MLLFKKVNVQKSITFATALFVIIVSSTSFSAAQVNTNSGNNDLPISLNEAIEIALVNSYVLQKSRLGVEEADAQIREAKSSVYPQIGGAANYTRNVKTPNPFAGSNAEELFTSFAAIDWLFYNERQRIDGNPTLSFGDYLDRQSDGLKDAGIQRSTSSNPFAVENQFILGISANQALYNGAAFAAIRGAEHFKTVIREQLERDTQNLVREVRTTYLGALLAQEQVKLLETSLEQLIETKGEISLMVDQGILSRFDRNSLEVEVVNLETMLIAAQNGAALAVRSLNIILGIPMEQSLILSNNFDDFTPTLPEVSTQSGAYEIALAMRPDIKQVEGAIRLRQEERNLTKSAYFPVLSAFADYAYIGSVPQNRTQTIADPDLEFTYSKNERGFFDPSYWNASFAVGLRLQWSLFDGFRTSARIQQVNVNIKRAELDAIMLRESIYLEIDQTLKNLEASWKRIESQRRNIQLAELNYQDSKSRLREGIGTRLEERQASNLLDQSKLNYLVAVHDFLNARAAYDNVLGLKTVEVQIND